MAAYTFKRRAARVVVLDPPKLIPGRLDISSGKRKYFDAAASWLLTDKKSPWRRLDWGMPLD